MAKKVFTEEEKKRAFALAERIQETIESNFAKAADDRVIGELKAMREELGKMGLFMSYTIGIPDLTNPENIEAEVTLWTLKDNAIN